MTRPDDEPVAEPTAEQIAERGRRADKATRGALAGVLGLEALVTLLVPRALAQTSSGLGGTKTGVLVALAVLLVAGAAVLRRRWGIGFGSVMQVAFLGICALLPSLLVAAIPFAGIWLFLLNLRNQIVGTPGGLRMLVS